VTGLSQRRIERVKELYRKAHVKDKSRFTGELKLAFKNYDNLPDEVQEALLIVAKIYGDVKKLPLKFSNFIKAGNWQEANKLLTATVIKNPATIQINRGVAMAHLKKAKALLKKAKQMSLSKYTPEQQKKINEAIEQKKQEIEQRIITAFNKGGIGAAEKLARKLQGSHTITVTI